MASVWYAWGMMRWLTGTSAVGVDVCLLVLRVAFGGMMLLGHGVPKIQKFGGSMSTFPDPLGIGGTVSFLGAVGSEVVCAGMVVVGLLTRAAALPLVFTMGVAAIVVHKNDGFFMSGVGGAKEPAVMYLAVFAAIALAGPGRLSADHAVFGKKRRPAEG